MATMFLILLRAYRFRSSQSLDDDRDFKACKTPVLCGKQNLSYPFWGVGRPKHCGRDALHLSCEQDEYLTVNISDTQFRVGEVNKSNYTMTLSRTDFNLGCPVRFINSTFNLSLFIIPQNASHLISIFCGCPLAISTKYAGNYSCSVQEGNNNSGLFYLDTLDFSGLAPRTQQSIMTSCTGRIEVPVSNEAYGGLFMGESLALQKSIDSGFLVEYLTEADSYNCSACINSGGSCGTNSSSDNQFACYCPDEPHFPVWGLHRTITSNSMFVVRRTVMVFVALLRSALSADPRYDACAPRNCGKGPNISYPFWISDEQESYCGLPNLGVGSILQ